MAGADSTDRRGVALMSQEVAPAKVARQRLADRCAAKANSPISLARGSLAMVI
jgi:hypothetical protein